MSSLTVRVLLTFTDHLFAKGLTFAPIPLQTAPMLPLSPSLADERAADFAHFLAAATEDELRIELDCALDTNNHWDAETIRDTLCTRFPSE